MLCALASGFALGPAHADDFLAMPGLWMTTLLSDASSPKPKKLTDWHCVDDEIDPWTSFVPVLDHPGVACTRTTSERTATSLKWHQECQGGTLVASDGELRFDSAQHYTGSIIEIRQINGHSVRQRIEVEGRRRAACTTPAD